MELDIDLVAADHGVQAQRKIAVEQDCCSDARAWYRGVGPARGPAVRRGLQMQTAVVVRSFERRTMARSESWSWS